MKLRELCALVEHIEKQEDVRVRKTKAGWFFYLPNGECTSLHTTLSDHRALKNFRAQIERAGLTWPT